MYGFNHRHHDSISKMKEIIISNKLGKLIWMRGRYGKSVTKDYFDEWKQIKTFRWWNFNRSRNSYVRSIFTFWFRF